MLYMLYMYYVFIDFVVFRYCDIHFVDVDALKTVASAHPVEPAHFEALVKQQCMEAREILSTKSVRR